MMGKRFACALALVIGASLFGPAVRAQESPALRNARSPEEKARIAALIEGAKKEGALTYWDVVIQPETNDALTAAFKARYGLPRSFQVNYNLASGPAFATRIEQEIAANRVTIDIGAFAVLNWVYQRADAGDLLAYDSPEHTHYGAAFEKGIALKSYFVPNGAYIFVPMWSEDRFKVTAQSYRELLPQLPAGRLSVGDGNAPPQTVTYAGLRQVLDADYFRALAKLKPSFLVRSEQVASRVVQGEDLIAMQGMPTRAYQFNQRGAKLKFMLPKEGVVLMPQGTFILAKAPHPNAAKLWIDFILSEEGQTILVKQEALISARSGFTSPLPDYAPSIDSLNVIPVDWRALTPQRFEAIKAEWKSIFQP